MLKKPRLSNGNITIREVAIQAGVSPMTVSRVINEEVSVSSDLRDRVLSAIRELKFKPNASARRLAAVRGTTIALLYDNPSRGFMGEFLIGALDECNRAGAQLLVRKFDNSEPIEEIVDSLSFASVEGVMLVPPLADSTEIVRAITAASLAAVAVAGALSDPGCPTIRIDNERAAAEAADHLHSLGHKTFGFIGPIVETSGPALRLNGFKDRLIALEIPAEHIGVESGSFTYEAGYVAAERLFSLSRRPTAIFAANDEMAAGALGAAQAHGLSVPDDLAIVGFDDTPIARAVTPALTTIHQPILEMAAQAVSALVDAIKAKEAQPATAAESILEHKLIVRGSSLRRRPAY